MKRIAAAIVVVALAFGAASLAVAAKKGKMGKGQQTSMKILSFTGQVQIKMDDGSIVGVVPGAPVPEIPQGSEIVVVSGEAVFEAGGTVVTATKGDSFTFDASAGAIQIAATGSKSSVQVTVGKTEAVVETGDAVQITGKGKGKGELKVTAGKVVVTTDGATTNLAKGQSVVVDTPVTTVAAAPEPTPEPSTEPSEEPGDIDTGEADMMDMDTGTTEPPLTNPMQDISPSSP